MVFENENNIPKTGRFPFKFEENCRFWPNLIVFIDDVLTDRLGSIQKFIFFPY
jgi:hypothetical protein